MALTSRIVANIYGKNGNPIEKTTGTPNGRINYFSNDDSTFYTSNGESFNGVVCNSIIEVFPHGLRVNSDLYYAVETIAQLVTNGI